MTALTLNTLLRARPFTPFNSMKPLAARLGVALLCMAAASAHAELQTLEDGALSGVHGGGFGLVLDQYALTVDAGSTWTVGVGGTTAKLVFSEFAWTPSDGTATLGRVEDPIYFDVLTTAAGLLPSGATGSRTYLYLKAPNNTLDTDLMDAKYLMTLDHISTAIGSTCTTATLCRYDTTRVTTAKMDVDGSFFKFWSEPLTRYTNQGAVAGTKVGLAYSGQINFGADSILFSVNEKVATTGAVTYNTNTTVGSYTPFTTAAGTASPLGNFRLGGCPTPAYCDNDAVMTARTNAGHGFDYVYTVGHDFYQPVTLHSLADGNFVIELGGIINNATVYNAFYTAPSNHLSIGSLITDWDGVAARPTNQWTGANQTGARRDFGYSRIENIRIHYLRVETIGL